MNNALRVKSPEEMVAEILPALTADMRETGQLDHELINLARHFGAELEQIYAALRLGREQRAADQALRVAELTREFEAAGWVVVKTS